MRVPDTIDFALPLPEPGLAVRAQRLPECRLLWAVLRAGIEDYTKYASATDRRGQRLFTEVQEWILQETLPGGVVSSTFATCLASGRNISVTGWKA